jgi:hypothetical protein
MTSCQPWIAALAVLLAACATGSVGEPEQYQPVPLNKVYPYPSAEELSEITSRVSLARRSAAGLPTDQVETSFLLIEQRLSGFLDETGAGIVDRGGDYVLLADISGFEYSASWKKPTNWLFKSEEEMASKPGTCTHRAEVVIGVEAFRGSERQHPAKSYTLRHSGEGKTENLDRTCPYGDLQRQTLFEGVIEEALQCLRIPVQNFFAPRGHVLEHRQTAEGGDHIFKTSLGSEQGVGASQRVEIYRVQLSTAADGSRARDERMIAEGEVTDGVGPDHSWISVDPSKASQPLLDGDAVRPVYRETFTKGLNPFGGCKQILEER